MTDTTAAPARPLVDFSDAERSRATVRGYAKDLQSRVNKPETNALLKQVAAGKMVDAYALAAALPDVFSGCATRHGQSTARREDTRKARAIAHIVHAVLDSHADALPGMEPGVRSRLVEDLRAEIAHASKVNQNLAADLTAERGKTARVRNDAAEAAEGYRMAIRQGADQIRIAEQRIIAQIGRAEEAEAKVEDLRAENSRLGREVDALRADKTRDLLTYALGLLDETERARFEGFRDAVTR